MFEKKIKIDIRKTIDRNDDKIKKQKINDKSNGDDEIDVTNLSKQTITQLKEIALSLGVPTKKNTEKKDIIKKIKLVNKRKQDILAKEEIYSNINSFNKGIIRFTVLDDIDPLEWLFWKVFRNKFIYKKIMSNMDKNLTLSYYSIINVTKMLEVNQIEILRDKVINGHHLSFECGKKNESNIFYESNESKIFNFIKNDNDQDKLFYSKLFNHYGKYLFPFFIKSNKSYDLPQEIIKFKCIPALKILIKEYKYKPSINCLKLSIDIGSIKILKLLFQQIKINGNLKNDLIKTLTQSNEFGFQSYKSLQYLQNENIIDITLPIKTNQLEEINNDCILKRFLKGRKTKVCYEFTLKILVLICKLILSITTFSIDGIIRITEIESLSNVHFTKKELKLPLSDKLFQDKEKKEFIKKLLKLYHQYCELKVIPEFYYLYYHVDNEIDYYGQGEGNGNIELLINDLKPYNYSHDKYGILLSLEFGNFQILNFYFQKCQKGFDNKINYVLKDIISNQFNRRNRLFSFCTNKNKQISFIDSLVNDIISKNEIEGSYYIINPGTLFNLLIDYNDIELLKYYETKFKSMNYKHSVGLFQISLYIQPNSISMLDHLFKNGYMFNIECVFWFNSMDLVDHYIKLKKKNINGKIVISQFLSINSKNIIPILKHIVKTNTNDHQFEFSQIQHQVYTYIFTSFLSTEDKLEISKLFFIKFHIGQFKRSEVCFFGHSTSLKKFLDWLFINYNDRLIQKIVSSIENTHLINQIDSLIYFETNRFDQINETIPLHHNLIYSVSQSGDYKLLNLILSRFQSSNKLNGINDYGLFLILENAAAKGEIKTFEFIHQNYKSLLKSKNGKNDHYSPFTYTQLNSILLKSISYNQIVLSEYLKLILPN